jgi:signal transduction histidine kinase/ActR/RegA family two-component response regulator
LNRGAAAVILPEEVVVPETEREFARWLANQPPWSDLPVIVLSRSGADSAAIAQAMARLGNVTVLERPTRVATFVSAIQTALRARRRQYQIRELLAEHLRSEEALREADRRKDEFLAILAHELRNPLAPIRNSLHILRLTTEHDDAERIRGLMERQVSHMVRLVDDLLEVSRITRGKIELRRELVEVAAIVRGAVETSQPLIDAADLQLAVNVPTESLMVDADPVRLTQVVANLLNNAAKYTDRGGQIWLVVKRDGDSVIIQVRDTGIGIPTHMLPRVFELFTQIDRYANRGQGGLGIGLTLVKSLVELHGGSVWAHSEGEGRGSVFSIRLPLAASPHQGYRSGEPDARSAVLASRRVLIVDDNRDAAESLGMLLSLLGAESRVVYSGPEALKVIPDFKPAVVLLDIGMPGMDGHEVARRIRQIPECRSLTLIALTGWGQEEDRHRSQSAGFDHHLIKPADVNTLQTLLLSLDSQS